MTKQVEGETSKNAQIHVLILLKGYPSGQIMGIGKPGISQFQDVGWPVKHALNGQDLPTSQFFAHSLLRHHLLSRMEAALHKSSSPPKNDALPHGTQNEPIIHYGNKAFGDLAVRNGSLGAASFTWHSGTSSSSICFRSVATSCSREADLAQKGANRPKVLGRLYV